MDEVELMDSGVTFLDGANKINDKYRDYNILKFVLSYSGVKDDNTLKKIFRL